MLPAGFLVSMTRALASAATRRMRQGPARPTWTLSFETVARAMQLDAQRIGPLDSRQQRVAMKQLAMPSRLLDKVDFEPVDAHGVASEWVRPREGSESNAVVLFVHGGGYVFGEVDTYRDLLIRIALASRARVLAPNYRLAPEHPCPAAIDDVVRTYRWLLAQGARPDRVVLAGDSAGGGACALAMIRLRDESAPMPAGAALLCPWVDLGATEGSMQSHLAWDWAYLPAIERWSREFAGALDVRDPRVSPAYADLRGLPPMLVQVGSAEILHDQVVAFASRAREAGVDTTLRVHDDMIHVWHALAPLFPQGQRAIEEVGAFVRARIRSEA
jgi:acetyl esterase/lipase